MPCYCSSPLPSNSCLLANRKCDKCWGSLRGRPRAGELGRAAVLWASPRKPSPILPPGASSDKTVDYTIHWFRTPEPETLETAASEDIVTSTDWRPGRDSGPQSHWSPHFTNPDLQEHCNDQDLVKRHQSITKVTPTRETPSCCTTIYCYRS